MTPSLCLKWERRFQNLEARKQRVLANKDCDYLDQAKIDTRLLNYHI